MLSLRTSFPSSEVSILTPIGTSVKMGCSVGYYVLGDRSIMPTKQERMVMEAVSKVHLGEAPFLFCDIVTAEEKQILKSVSVQVIEACFRRICEEKKIGRAPSIGRYAVECVEKLDIQEDVLKILVGTIQKVQTAFTVCGYNASLSKLAFLRSNAIQKNEAIRWHRDTLPDQNGCVRISIAFASHGEVGSTEFYTGQDAHVVHPSKVTKNTSDIKKRVGASPIVTIFNMDAIHRSPEVTQGDRLLVVFDGPLIL